MSTVISGGTLAAQPCAGTLLEDANAERVGDHIARRWGQ